ncbi:single-stranded DNA-binding protein [Ornithobacterium rhinotracheale]|uniref:single-stranded DNA-binding protein n=1 Tax=Ornithobacterium rhinotracheale TaxID=28251 RepID=UPI001FF163AB|nr:single-stranded DNA-binding protein [Ornithobacterium rhinotracheale]MCK0201398.1 single-stranded DNA-binding protein [Ornithobacterium rhinotracheale]
MFNLTAIGNLTKDAEVTKVGENNAIKFGLAINENYTDKSGEKKQNTTFINCTYWSKSAKIAEFLKKGKKIAVQIDWYENQEHDGRWFQNFRVRRLELVEPKKEQPIGTPPPSVENTANYFAPTQEAESDLPF